MRPLIGISTYREQARWGAWDVPAVLLPTAYAEAVATAGGEPVLLPTGATSDAVVRHLDGLVLAGGADVEPELYGHSPGRHTTVLRPDRDNSELAVLRAALAANLPLLAICRGMQLLNVAFGGTLIQHLPDLPEAGEHDPGPGLFARRVVRTEPGSELHRLLGGSASADCHHHQSLDLVGTGLTAAGWAEDGTVEAVEAAGHAFCLGVQWHPEAGEDCRLFEALVRVAGGQGG